MNSATVSDRSPFWTPPSHLCARELFISIRYQFRCYSLEIFDRPWNVPRFEFFPSINLPYSLFLLDSVLLPKKVSKVTPRR